MIYLDHQATTPVDPAVRAAMVPWEGERFANPHSTHAPGRAARGAVEAARARVAALLAADPAGVIFTSGATEAVNTAIKGVLFAAPPERRRLVTLATEHSCTLDSARWLERLGVPVTLLPVRSDGLIDLDVAARAIGPDVALLSVMSVNNEIGVIQPVAELAALAHAAGALVHVDAAQGFGKIDSRVGRLGADLLSLSGHKIYGPKGVGALYVRPGIVLEPLLHGGGQEGGGLRSGTLAPALCVGLGAAAAIAAERIADDAAHAERLWQVAAEALTVDHRINGSTAHRWRGNLNVAFPGVDGARLLPSLRGLAVASGAACASAAGRPSHVLAALGLDRRLAAASLRIGWGRYTTHDEVREGVGMICDAVQRLQRRAA